MQISINFVIIRDYLSTTSLLASQNSGSNLMPPVDEFSEIQNAGLRLRAHTLMEEALKILDTTGDHWAGAKLDDAICALGLRSNSK